MADQTLKKATQALAAADGKGVLKYTRKLLAADPTNFDYLHLQGLGYRLQKDSKSANKCFQKALASRPEGSATLFCNLAFEALATNRKKSGSVFKAEEFLDRARKLNPQLAEVGELAAHLAMRTGDYVGAVELLNKALEINPRNSDLLVRLTKAYRELVRFPLASQCLDKAEAIAPNSPKVRYARAETLDYEGRTEEALVAYESVKALDANTTEIIDQRTLGVLRTHGKKGALKDRCLDVMEKNPKALQAHLALVTLGEYPGGTEAAIAYIDEQRPNRKTGKRPTGEYFAIAQGYEKEGNHAKSFEWYLRGNESKHSKRRQPYDVQEVRDYHARIRSFFSSGDPIPAMPIDPDFPTPIFVLGMPRSGTSLTEQLLGSHSAIHPAGELGYLPKLIKYGHREFEVTRKHREPQYWHWVREAYLKSISMISENAPFVIDKMPHNFQHVGFIRKLFPHAIIVHTPRDPISNCLSIFKANFAGYHPYAYNLEVLGQYYAEYHRLMAFWRQCFPGEIYDSNYEHLVGDTRSAIEHILGLCNLEWEDDILNFHESDRIVRTASNDQVRQPIYASSVASWKKYEKQLQPLIKVLVDENIVARETLAS